MKLRFRRVLLYLLAAAVLIGALVINAPGIAALYYAWRYTSAVEALPEVQPFNASDRLLVLSPHPDDESLCCAGSVQQALAAGAAVYIVWLTSGDGFELDGVLVEDQLRPVGEGMLELGEKRIGEARAAAAILGVSEENLFFLGYPDGGLLHLFTANYTVPYRSRYTNETKVAYPEAVSPGLAYTGENLEHDLQQVVSQVQPTVVLAPSPQEIHPDHRTTSYLALRLMGERGELAKLRYYIVHGGLEWPLPKGWHKRLALFPPPRGRGMAWMQVPLTPKQIAVKESAVRSYHSQMEVLGRFMAAFVRTNELQSLEPLPVGGQTK